MSRDRLKVALDMDDVILAFTDGVYETINRDYDARLNINDVRTWMFGQFGMDDVLGYDWWEWMEEHAYLWGSKFKPVPGAIGGINTLRREGFDLEIVTSKPPWAERFVWEWLAKYSPAVTRVTIVDATASRQGVQPAKKHEVSDADILVDDRDKNVLEWVDSAKDRYGIIFTRPWNEDMVLPERVYRASNWAEIIRIIHQLDEEM